MRRWIALTILVSSFGVLGTIEFVRAENPLSPATPAAGNAPFAGTFSGENIGLELTFDANQSAYTGWLTVNGNRFALGGFDDNGTLTGKFVASGQQYDFKATMAGEALSLESGGKTHNLKRQGAMPVNPMDPQNNNPPQNPNPQNPGVGGVGGVSIGGVGIGFEPAQDGKLMVRAIMPGGPADKAKLRAEGWLVAVDGKSIEGIAPEQLRKMITGPVGSQVTLTIENETEVADVILIRADISGGSAPQPAPNPNPQSVPNPGQNDFPKPGGMPTPPPGGMPAPMPGGMTPGAMPAPMIPSAMPQAVNNKYPAWLKPGVRITMYSSSATLKGVNQVLVPDEKGNWVDGNGRRYGIGENASASGAGLLQLDVLEVSDKGLLVDGKSLLIVDQQSGDVTSTGAMGYAGNADSLGEFWVNPAKLATLQAGAQAGIDIQRMQYPLNGKNYNAISFTNKQQNGFQRNTFDTDTGLALVATFSSVGAVQVTPGAGGESQQGAGNTMIGYSQLADVRETKLPWANDAMPDWMAQGHSMQFSGSYMTTIPNSPDMAPWKYSIRFDFGQRMTTAVLAKQSTALDMGNGQPQQGSVDRVVGCNLVGPLYISPATLKSLQPNQLIDEDKMTKSVYTFNGIQGNMAVFTEKRARESTQFGYDVNSGVLSMISFEQFQGMGTLKVQLKLDSMK